MTVSGVIGSLWPIKAAEADVKQNSVYRKESCQPGILHKGWLYGTHHLSSLNSEQKKNRYSNMPGEIDNEAISKAFDAKDNDSLAAHYEKWAAAYDADTAAAGLRLPLLQLALSLTTYRLPI